MSRPEEKHRDRGGSGSSLRPQRSRMTLRELVEVFDALQGEAREHLLAFFFDHDIADVIDHDFGDRRDLHQS